MDLKKSWSDLKTLIINKKLNIQYEKYADGNYFVWAFDSGIIYSCQLTINIDITDFENNYKAEGNKQIHQHTQTIEASNYYASEGNTIIDINNITGINIANGWVETSSIISVDRGILVTDVSMSSNKDGIFRFTLDGESMGKYIYYRAKDFISVTRNLPYYIPMNKKIAIEFKTDTDDADVSTCIGGLKV